jgi:hypothetical protein
MVEARWRQLVVSSHDPSADEQIAEAIARVLSRYAVDLSSGVEVPMMHDGVKVTYVAKRALSLVSALRAARTATYISNELINLDAAASPNQRAA